MYKCEREDEILAILGENDYVSVEFLSQKMNISPSSIRRDLKNLEERGMVSRTYGGVKLAGTSGKHIPFALRFQENAYLKKAIARSAVEMLSAGESVFIDGSSTAFFMTEYLPQVPGVTVFTNSIDIMSALSKYDIKAYCTGGEKSEDNRAVLVGGYTQSFLRHIRADYAFFSVQGVLSNGEFYDCYAEEVAVRNVMMENASKSILLCDSSKLGTPSTFYQGSMKDIDLMICDKDPADFFLNPNPKLYRIAGEK